MAKKKFTSKTFHQAAQNIIKKYFDEIPGFKLRTENNFITNSDGKQDQEFWIIYERDEMIITDFDIYIKSNNPNNCLQQFAREINYILQTDSLTNFDFVFTL